MKIIRNIHNDGLAQNYEKTVKACQYEKKGILGIEKGKE